MTADEVRAVVLRLLGERAPEADLAQLKPDRSLREQLDLDSIDYLNFLISLNKELKVEIPEKDFPRLATLQDCVAYLREKHAGEKKTA
jgi:acyl carrier protein